MNMTHMNHTPSRPRAGTISLRDRIIREAGSTRDVDYLDLGPQADEWTLTLLGSLRDARQVSG